MTLTSPEFLTNLPGIVFMWTCLSLTWGMFALVMYNKMISERARRGFVRRMATDRCNSRFIILANIVLFTYLAVEPWMQAHAGESFIIINIFYSAYLVSASARLFRWWKEKTLKEHKQASLVDHLVI